MDGPMPKERLSDLSAAALARTEPERGGGPEAGGVEPEPALSAALDRLRDLALVYGPDDALDLGPGVRKVLEDPAGLGPRAVDAFRHHSPEQLDEMADDVAPGTTGSRT